MDGVLNVYKPVGMTSYDVVHKLKKICGTGKIGHTGTLDPAASGVLPVCVGKATKIVDYIMSDKKVYKAHLKLGITTDTYDAEGTILSEASVSASNDEVVKVINSFVGEIMQLPPMYSAIKVNGKRLYELARKGIEIEREKRKIFIYSIKILDLSLPDVIFLVECSKGTYIRSLCFDIGTQLGCGGTMWGLERVKSGIFSVENSVKLEDLSSQNYENHMISIEQALQSYEAVHIPGKYEKMILNGVAIKDTSLNDSLKSNALYRVYIDSARFIGLGEKLDSGFKMVKMLL